MGNAAGCCAPAPGDVPPEATAGVKSIETTPALSQRTVEASMRDIRTLVGVPELTPERVCALLEKMQLGPAVPVPADGAAGGDAAAVEAPAAAAAGALPHAQQCCSG